MNSIPSIFAIDFLFIFNKSGKLGRFNLNRLVGSIIKVYSKMKKITFTQIAWRWMLKMSSCKLGAKKIYFSESVLREAKFSHN